MLARNLVSVFLSQDWKPPTGNQGDVIRAWLPIHQLGHSLLRQHKVMALMDTQARPCCMRCLTVVDKTPIKYGKLYTYCPTCLIAQPDKVKAYYDAIDMRDYLLRFFQQYYTIYEAEAIICQAIESMNKKLDENPAMPYNHHNPERRGLPL